MPVKKRKAVVTGEKMDGQLRLALGVLGGYLMSKGVIGQSEMDLALAVAPIAAAGFWSYWSK